ncbi:Neogenin [Nymphon striatum]|nr:Neogenin [Nymphon striatum]
MCVTLPAIAQYLLDLGFQYVLLGQLQSDVIESRFGRYRQMSGANYFVSVKQILEAELKIKAASLLKFSGIDQLNLLTSGESASGLKDESYLDQIALDFTNVIVEKGCGNLNSADKNVIYYVTGAVVRSHIRQSKCDSCQKILSDGPLSPLTEENVDGIDDATKVFLQDINRGDPNQKESSSKQIKHRYQTNDKLYFTCNVNMLAAWCAMRMPQLTSSVCAGELTLGICYGQMLQKPPSAPRNLDVVGDDDDPATITLNWQLPKLQNGKLNGYVIFYTTDNTKLDRDWVVEGVGRNDLTKQITGLTLDTTYYFKIQAHNSNGYGPFSQTVLWTTSSAPPSAPRHVTIVADDDDPLTINLNWQPPKHHGKRNGYIIFYRTDNTKLDKVQEAVESNALTKQITGLTPDTRYYFQVEAHNIKGYGPFSQTVVWTTTSGKSPSSVIFG